MSRPAPSAPPRLEYDPALPITAHRGEILEALARHPILVICGATGSGKTTQLPKMCLEAGRGVAGVIGHTQPRRIAARALANRLAEELGTTVGGAIGYKVRFNDQTNPQTRIKLMTDGILLKELESDRSLRRYDTLILDEAHERSLNIDLLLGVLKRLAPRRPDLRVIVTSATIDPAKFAAFFDGAPVIEVSGRSYPVELRYRPLSADDEDAADLSLSEGIVAAVRELDGKGGAQRGDTLVFLPGEKHIREAAEQLEEANLHNTEVLPLFARLSARDQERIFQRHGPRRVVLSTNVAETSLTVPGIRYVVDSGLARISRYSVRNKVQRLPIERVSRASADQRKGRCGREADGICIRLYSEEDFGLREDFTPPEVLRTNLASVILRMAAIGLGAPEDFPFLDAPDTRLVNDGVRLLQELKAMDEDRKVTGLGRKIAGLPVDPRLGRMLLAASNHNCMTEMLVITSFLEAQDPRERPQDAQQQAGQKHSLFTDERSDFVTVLNLWRAFNEQAAALSGNQLRKWCREHFLSFVRMREWQELHSQLSEAVKELELRPNQMAASYPDLHQAILTGFLGSIGSLDEKREYDGPRGTRFVIAPGTPLASKPPKWIAAGSLVETTRVYARMVASVNPLWIEAAGEHLLKRTYTEPHWVLTGGYVAAFETVTLYGLTLASRRRINFGMVEPRAARDLFIREALVNEPEVQTTSEGHRSPEDEVHAYSRGRHRDSRAKEPARIRGEFLTANRALYDEIERLEAKIRRRDILVDEQAQVDFYAARIPEPVNSVALFDRWRLEAEKIQPRLLYMSRADLMQRDGSEAGGDPFPDELQVGANLLPLEYHFEPSEPLDGVTLTVPEPLLDVLNTEQLAWLVPGLRLEKVTELFRALPKSQRKLLVPVPEHARAAMRELFGDDGANAPPRLPGFYAWLSGWITQRVGSQVSAAELASLELPAHLRMNIRVVDAKDRVMAQGRDLAALKRRIYGSTAPTMVANPLRPTPGARGGAGDSPAVAVGAATPADAVHRQWDFGDLPESREIERNRLRLVVYPAVEDRGAGVALIEARTQSVAATLSRAGLTRLSMLGLPQQAKYVTKLFTDQRDLVLLSRGLPLSQTLPEALTLRAFRECFFPADVPLPRTQAEFGKLLDTRRGTLNQVAERLGSAVLAAFTELRAVRAGLGTVRSPVFADAVADINGQIEALLPANFIEVTPRPWLDYLPRYLKAVTRRLERLADNVQRDTQLALKVKPFAAALRVLQTQPSASPSREEFDQLRWMIEEFRVSLFAQELKTMLKVSDKRLAEQLTLAKAEAQAL